MSVLTRWASGKGRKRDKVVVPSIMLGDMDGAVGSAGTSRMSDFQDYLGAVTIPNVYMAASVISYAAASLPMDILDENDTVVENLGKVAPRPGCPSRTAESTL